jgi:putative oxidoreductase
MTTSSNSSVPPRSAWADTAQSLLRIVAAGIFMQHGAQKLLGAFADPAVAHAASQHLTTRLLIAGCVELFGGGLILIGLFTRVAAFIASGEMAVAYFTVHIPRAFWPIQNKGELALVLCFIFFFLAAAGGGPYSVDYLIAWRRRR